MLAQHPDVLARLRGEIMNKVGTTKIPTYDDLKDMKYLRAVINGGGIDFNQPCAS
jgi:Cytochrome P450